VQAVSSASWGLLRRISQHGQAATSQQSTLPQAA
jgi:hypothetical protein